MDAEANLEGLCKQNHVFGNLRLSELLTFLTLTQSNAPDWAMVCRELKKQTQRTLSGDECRDLFTFLRSETPAAFELVKSKPEQSSVSGFVVFFKLFWGRAKKREIFCRHGARSQIDGSGRGGSRRYPSKPFAHSTIKQGETNKKKRINKQTNETKITSCGKQKNQQKKKKKTTKKKKKKQKKKKIKKKKKKKKKKTL